MIKQAEIYELGHGMRAEFEADSDQLRVGYPNTGVMLTRPQWLALVELLQPRVAEAVRADFKDELARTAASKN